MIATEYKGTAVNKRFWFTEFREVIDLLNKGLSIQEIKDKQQDDNFILANSESYGKKTVNGVIDRINSLPKEIVKDFYNYDLRNQKIINLMTIMMTDRFFFDYVYEVYRLSIIEQDFNVSSNKEVMFLVNKEKQVEKVANFTDQTKKRVVSSFKNYLIEANLIRDVDGIIEYTLSFLDEHLKDQLKINGMNKLLIALAED